MTAAITPVAPARLIPRVTFLVSRVVLAGRGSTNGPDSESGVEVLFEDKPLSLWETVAELKACDELSCGREVKASDLQGSEYALTKPRSAARGWHETEMLIVKRHDGKPVEGRLLHWLFRLAELV